MPARRPDASPGEPPSAGCQPAQQRVCPRGPDASPGEPPAARAPTGGVPKGPDASPGEPRLGDASRPRQRVCPGGPDASVGEPPPAEPPARQQAVRPKGPDASAGEPPPAEPPARQQAVRPKGPDASAGEPPPFSAGDPTPHVLHPAEQTTLARDVIQPPMWITWRVRSCADSFHEANPYMVQAVRRLGRRQGWRGPPRLVEAGSGVVARHVKHPDLSGTTTYAREPSPLEGEERPYPRPERGSRAPLRVRNGLTPVPSAGAEPAWGDGPSSPVPSASPAGPTSGRPTAPDAVVAGISRRPRRQSAG